MVLGILVASTITNWFLWSQTLIIVNSVITFSNVQQSKPAYLACHTTTGSNLSYAAPPNSPPVKSASGDNTMAESALWSFNPSTKELQGTQPSCDPSALSSQCKAIFSAICQPWRQQAWHCYRIQHPPGMHPTPHSCNPDVTSFYRTSFFSSAIWRLTTQTTTLLHLLSWVTINISSYHRWMQPEHIAQFYRSSTLFPFDWQSEPWTLLIRTTWK